MLQTQKSFRFHTFAHNIIRLYIFNLKIFFNLIFLCKSTCPNLECCFCKKLTNIVFMAKKNGYLLDTLNWNQYNYGIKVEWYFVCTYATIRLFRFIDKCRRDMIIGGICLRQIYTFWEEKRSYENQTQQTYRCCFCCCGRPPLPPAASFRHPIRCTARMRSSARHSSLLPPTSGRSCRCLW